MKLPINLGGKWLVILAVVVTAAIVAPTTAKITSVAKNREIAKMGIVYQKQIDKLFGVVNEAIRLPKYSISNTWTIEKNKKGQMVFVPTSTMEVNEVLKSIDEKLKSFASVDTLQTDIKPRSFWDRIKFWKY